MREVLYISYDGMTDPLGMSQVLPYLKELSLLGYHINLVSFEKPESFRKKRTDIDEIVRKAGIDWFPQEYHKRPPVLSTIKDIMQMNRIANEICVHKKIEIVHCRSYIAALVGQKISRKYKAKMIFDMRGFWADERVEGKLWNLGNPLFKLIYSYFKKKERDLLMTSDAVISLTSKAKEIMKEQFGKDVAQKITVIPCCTDLSHFSESAVDKHLRERFRNELKIRPGEKVLSYVGSLGTWYMSEEMVDFFQQALREKKFDRFLVITKDDPSALLRYAVSKGVPSDTIVVRPADRSELPSLIDLSEWSLFFIRPSYSKSASSPTKMGELLAMGKGIIANKGIGDNDLLFSRYSCGVLVESFTEESYRKSLEKLVEFDPSGTRRTAESYFSLGEGVRKYQQVYESLIG